MAPKADTQTAIATLQGGEVLRVWSFLVTLFGDITRGKGGALRGQSLATLTGPVGIKPATMRVALHRLRKDGWIDSRKDGRNSWVSLTDHGRAETLAFSTRVYGQEKTGNDPTKVGWKIFIAPQGLTQGIPPGMSPIPDLNRVFIGHGDLADTTGFLSVTGTLGPVPSWLQTALTGPQLRQDYRDFLARITTVSSQIPAQISAHERAILRGLIVHSWRRLLLRHPDLPDALFGPDLCLPACRSKVTEILTHLGPVSPADLNERSDHGVK